MPLMAQYANSSSARHKDAISILSLHTRRALLPIPDRDGITATFWWTPPANTSPSWTASSTTKFTTATRSSSGVLTTSKSVVSHSYAAPEPSPMLSSEVVAAPPGSRSGLLTSSAVGINTTAGNGGKTVVTITTTVAAHRSATATALLPGSTSAWPEDLRRPGWDYWTLGHRVIVVLSVFVAGILIAAILVWFWQVSWGGKGPASRNVERGRKSRRILKSAAVDQRIEGMGGGGEARNGWSILGGDERQGSAQGSSRCTSGPSGNSISRSIGDAIMDDAVERGRSSDSASSYASAVEYKNLGPAGIEPVYLSRSTTSSSGPTGPRALFDPTSSLDLRNIHPSSGLGQISANPLVLRLLDTTAASTGSANAVAPDSVREIQVLGSCRPFQSRRNPLTTQLGNGTVSPVLELELGVTGYVRGATGPEEHVGQPYVPWATGSLQERLLGKYPARWG